MNFTPIKFRTKEEMRAEKERLRKMGKKGLIKHLIKLGWSKGSAQTIADGMFKSVGLDKNESRD